MQYLIMLAIVTGLAASDFITGIIKGYTTGTLSSTKMRKGGLTAGGRRVTEKRLRKERTVFHGIMMRSQPLRAIRLTEEMSGMRRSRILPE